MQPFKNELSIAVLGLGGFGVYLLYTSTQPFATESGGINALVGGCVSLTLAVALLIIGIFAYRPKN